MRCGPGRFLEFPIRRWLPIDSPQLFIGGLHQLLDVTLKLTGFPLHPVSNLDEVLFAGPAESEMLSDSF